MAFVADDLAAWLIGLLADTARKRMTTVILGTDQERALRSAATEAVRLVAQDLHPGDSEKAEHLAQVISEVFGDGGGAAPLTGPGTVLEALQAGIAGELKVLDDPSLTGTGQSAADALGIPGTALAGKLTSYLLRQIVVRGARGGPLFPLASQLNADVTHLQGLQMQVGLRELGHEIMETLTQLDPARGATAEQFEAALSYVRRFTEILCACQDVAPVFRETGQRTDGRSTLTKLAHALQEVCGSGE